MIFRISVLAPYYKHETKFDTFPNICQILYKDRYLFDKRI